MNWKHPITVIVMAVVVTVVWYYILSLYQNCARLYPNDLLGCIIQTSW